MSAITGHGTTFSLDGGTTTVANVTNVGAPNVSLTMIDSSDMDSTWRTFLAGLKDGGEATLSINYDPSAATHIAVETAIDGAEKACVITWSDASDMQFNAIISGFQPTAPQDDKLTADVTFKVSGAITF